MKKRSRILRALLRGAASVLDIGATSVPVYKDASEDAKAIAGDVRRVGRYLRKSMTAATS